MKIKNNSIRFFIVVIFIISSVYAQLDYGINYELKYFDGQDEDGIKIDVFEHYFDINVYYNDLYFYSFLKYKDPAFIGSPTKKFKDIYNVFFLEYSNDKLQFQVGDIFNSFGSGLSFYTYEDRTIDYNNAPRGISLLYYLRNNIDIFATIGANRFSTRKNSASQEPDIYIDNSVMSAGFSYQHEYFDIHYLGMINEQYLESQTIVNLKGLNNMLGEYLTDRYDIDNNPNDFEMRVLEHNLGTNFYLGDLELYFEKSWVYHNKIEDERIQGYRYYFSSYLNINDYSILYEYKNYNTPYHLSVYSNPPIVSKENSSTLISRNLHNVNFSNEVGHHIVINKSFSDQVNISLSSAFAYRHVYDNAIEEPGFGEILNSMVTLESIQKFENLLPYRQIYLELHGWSSNDKIYYKIGLDNYFEYIDNGYIIKAKTIPTQFTLNLAGNKSLSTYFEYQNFEYLHWNPSQRHEFMYFSPSYNHKGKWIISLFYDYEKGLDSYLGSDLTYYISNNNMLSIFFGSQKGGLVCTNGTCVKQPDFEKGFKISSSIIF